MALYQYIPPTSCHPPGTLIGLVFHQVLQIFQLCSRSQDIDLELAPCYHRLLEHGYKATGIMTFLIKVILDNTNHCFSLTKAHREEAKKAQTGYANERVLFHLSFHPPNTHPQVLSSIPGKI